MVLHRPETLYFITAQNLSIDSHVVHTVKPNIKQMALISCITAGLMEVLADKLSKTELELNSQELN